MAFSIAHNWSRRSREKEMDGELSFLGEEKEWLIIYAKEKLKTNNIDFFVFGHRHLPINHQLTENSTYINLGDWIHHNTYAILEDTEMKLENLRSRDY